MGTFSLSPWALCQLIFVHLPSPRLAETLAASQCRILSLRGWPFLEAMLDQAASTSDSARSSVELSPLSPKPPAAELLAV